MTIHPTDICEAILREDRQYNVDHDIWPSQNIVIDRLLARRLELDRAFSELHAKLSPHPRALNEFLRVILEAAALWNPDRNEEAREDYARLIEVNREIGEKANELALLFEERAEIHNTSAFYSNTHYHPITVMEEAAKNNGHFRIYVMDEISALRGRFDLKYWPSIADFLRVLSDDADLAKIRVGDPSTEAAIKAKRSSKADAFKALFALIDDNRTRERGRIPNDFRLTDETLASFFNCAFGLSADEGVDAAYVKRLRQRERGVASAAREG